MTSASFRSPRELCRRHIPQAAIRPLLVVPPLPRSDSSPAHRTNFQINSDSATGSSGTLGDVTGEWISLNAWVANFRDSGAVTDAQRLAALAQARRLAQGPINVLTVVAGIEAGVIFVIEAGPAALNAYARLSDSVLSVEAAFPGATDIAVDILDVLGPTPAIGATKVGMIVNVLTNVIPQVYDVIADHTWRKP